MLTREQAKCKLWYQFRAGRVTASKFKAASRTKISQPSKSLIKQICYPESTKFSTEATKWGLDNETKAQKAYLSVQIGNHQNFKLTGSGLVINTAYPHLGATPDGCATCDCCGYGLIEIKCPFSCAEKKFEDACKTSGFFLDRLADGTYRLKESHAYYYQVQAQILLCKAGYCDFVVWSTKDLVVVRIKPDKTFFEDEVKKVTEFFIHGIMPELIGKWYSTPSSSDVSSLSQESSSKSDDSNEQWCYCRGEDEGEMIFCDGESCLIKWFHVSCLKLSKIPKNDWYCPDCRKKY